MNKKKSPAQECLDDFDFEKVHKAMVAVGWTWAESLGTPSIAEMRVCALSCLERALEIRGMSGTGGFMARFDENGLTLEFRLEEATIELS